MSGLSVTTASHVIHGIPVYASDNVQYHHPVIGGPPQRVVFVHPLILWVWKIHDATLPASTFGAEFVADILEAS